MIREIARSENVTSIEVGAGSAWPTRDAGDDCRMIERVPLAGGRIQPLGVGFSPSVSPDGRLLAWVDSHDCGRPGIHMHVQALPDGEPQSWGLDFEVDAGLTGILWAADGRHVHRSDCAGYGCDLVRIDTHSDDWSTGKAVGPSELDGDDFSTRNVVRRGSHVVFTVEGFVGDDDSRRHPTLEIDPATGGIVHTLFDDGRGLTLLDFDDSGEYLFLKDAAGRLVLWAGGQEIREFPGYILASWIDS